MNATIAELENGVNKHQYEVSEMKVRGRKGSLLNSNARRTQVPDSQNERVFIPLLLMTFVTLFSCLPLGKRAGTKAGIREGHFQEA